VTEQPKHTTIATNGVNLHVVQAGRSDGELLILLHGFPDFWYGWRKQIPYLAELGFRVWVPDQRGYNLSDKPQGVYNYTLDVLAKDVIGLIDAAGVEKACIVGHDWGAAVGWRLANQYPQRVKKMVILNVPHPTVARRIMLTNFSQMRRSWYVFFFQLPFLPQWMSSLFDFRGTAMAMQRSARPGTFTKEDLQEYRRSWGRTGNMLSMINWYRAAAQLRVEKLPSPRITVPTLIIWGKQDTALEPIMAERSLEICDDGKLVYIDDATHWVHHEEPEQVNALIGEFLT
jgi:pimeloyl-ACP methyl ester carboxylesterase